MDAPSAGIAAEGVGSRPTSTPTRRLRDNSGNAMTVPTHSPRARPGEQAAILAEMDRVTEAREAAQPIREKTGGSTFKNPPGGKAWQLVDAAGCRGLVVGDAQVSEMHCNFLINRGAATAADIEGLGEEVRRRVRERHFGFELEWEIKRIGVAA